MRVSGRDDTLMLTSSVQLLDVYVYGAKRREENAFFVCVASDGIGCEARYDTQVTCASGDHTFRYQSGRKQKKHISLE